ncbi:MAG TPA: MFS transporter, partial [Acidimicrobiales bacterium]|nr:MFS transporter [Acidimicrobiales bacterium]
MLFTAPLRHRDFRLLWTGMAVSLVGDGVFLVAVAWQVYSISGSPSALAYVGLATSLPQVAFVLLGGAVSDRWPRRLVLVWSDGVRAATLVALGVTVLVGRAHLVELCAAGALVGTATAFASPAFDALVPQLVPPGELTQANGIEQFVRPSAAQLAGPALGGLAVLLVHPAGSFILDGATFAFSGVCAIRLRVVGTAAHDDQVVTRLRQDVADGLRYVRRHSWLWATFLSATVTYLLFIGPTQVLLPYVVRYSLHQGAATYGTVLAVGGVGALVGALFSGQRAHPRQAMVWIYSAWTLATLAVAGYGLATNAVGLAGAALVVNGAEAAGTVVWATLKQRR